MPEPIAMIASARIITDGTQRMFQITIPTLLTEPDELLSALTDTFRAAALAEHKASEVLCQSRITKN